MWNLQPFLCLTTYASYTWVSPVGKKQDDVPSGVQMNLKIKCNWKTDHNPLDDKANCFSLLIKDTK